MKLDQAIDHFLEHLRIERGLAANTLKAYRTDLEHLWRYLTENGQEALALRDVSTLHLKDYIAHLRDDRQYKPRSIGRIMSSIRVFFEFCRRRGLVEAEPAAALHNPKIPKKLPVYMIDDEVRRLLRAPDRGDPIGCRDHALLATFVFTGLRLSELVGLNVEDVDFATGTILVRGKGSKERLLPLHGALRRILEGYLESERRVGPVFQTEDGRRMTPRMVGYAVRKAVAQAGLSHRFTPHKLRHTFATQLLHNGANLLDIKELLGHSRLATTSIYTHTNVDRLRRAVEKIGGA